jgi:hypothetical protein
VGANGPWVSAARQTAVGFSIQRRAWWRAVERIDIFRAEIIDRSLPDFPLLSSQLKSPIGENICKHCIQKS